MKNNITLIEFKDSDSISVGPLYQWDKGQVFQFLENYPLGTEVQFDDGSTKVIVDSMVKVPNKILQSPGNHSAWFQVIGPDDETTVKYIRFMVNPRKKKNDYIEPEDETTFREDIQSIMNQTKNIADSVRKDADDGKFKGEKGDKGDPGPQGEPGQDGHTPVKGVDYWTAADQKAIYAEAEQALRDQEQSSVAAIREAGAEEVGKVQRKGTEVLESIPEDYFALTAEVGGLKSDLGYVKNVTVTEKYSTNLYNEANAEVGYRCVGGGATTTAENSVLSEYIAIPDGMTYAVPSAYYNGRYRVFCYSYGFADESKNPIAGSGGPQTSAISIPDGAKYFRCSWLTTTTEQRFINFNTDGSLFPYEEYYDPIVSIKTAEDVTKKLNEHETRISDLENSIIGSDVKRVICWGDSLTDGSGSSDTNHQYPFVLRSLINANNTGIVTDSAGQGGEGTYSIATRQGGVVVNVKPCTVPASGSVNVEIDKWNGLTISLCRRGGKDVTTDNAKMKINPCYIAGVKGTLLRDSNSKYVFTRAESGDEVTFDRPVPLLTYGRENLNGENEVAVIWSGTNDIASNGGTIEKTIQGINMMIDKLKSKKYIVVGLTSKAYHSDIDDKNFRMATEYKDHFVNVRDYMLSYGLDDYGITPTEQDLTDISNGEIPSSLRVDDVHGNDYFYDIVAKQVYKKGQELGYWN